DALVQRGGGGRIPQGVGGCGVNDQGEGEIGPEVQRRARLGARGGCESLSLGEQGLTERGARPGALEGVEVARLEEGAQLVRGGDRLPADRQGAGAADARKAPVSPGARRALEGRGGAGGVSDLETKVAEFQPEKTVGGPPGSGL